MDFAAMFQTWINVLTKPGEATFVAEGQKPQAQLSTAIIWIVLAAAIAAVLSALGAVISSAVGGGMASMMSLLNDADIPPEIRSQVATYMAGSTGGGAFGAFCFTLILAPIGFLIGSGIYFILAKLFGGTGSFEEQTYLLATFVAPITVVNGILGLIPFAGGCLSFFISIYQLVLTYFAIKVSHNLTSGKAVGVILIPIVVIFACAACLFVALFFTIFSAANSSQF